MKDIQNLLVTMSFERVASSVEDSEIIIVEGFESLGKEAITKRLESHFNYTENSPHKIFIYRPNFENVDYASLTKIDNRYMLRFPILEFFSELKRVEDNSILILDKSIFSDIVKCNLNEIYIPTEVLFANFGKLIKDYKVSIIHVSLPSTNREFIINDQEVLDNYVSFDAYFECLSKAELEYMKVYTAFFEERQSDNIKFIKYYIGGV